MQMQSGNSKLAIDCFGFYAVSAIFQPCNGLSWLLIKQLKKTGL